MSAPPVGVPSRPDPRVSVVLPVYNEQAVLPLLLERLRPCLDRLPAGGELVFVDDGSRDDTAPILDAAAAADPRVRVLHLSRNFGHPAAISAGLDRAGGDVVVVMDADLQDPPELIERLVGAYREGYDVVHARRTARLGESGFKKVTAQAFYAVMGTFAERPPEPHVGEFRLMSRAVVEALRRMPERHRLVRGMVTWLGFRQTCLEFERPGRAAGETKFPLRRMLRLSWDAVTSFSYAPLRLATIAGVVALAVSLAGGALLLRAALARGIGPSLPAVLLVTQIGGIGLVLLCVGLLGEYVGRIFDEVRGRPLYVVRDAVGFDPSDDRG